MPELMSDTNSIEPLTDEVAHGVTLPNPTQLEIEDAGRGYYGFGKEGPSKYIHLLRQKKVWQSHKIKDQAATIQAQAAEVEVLLNAMQDLLDAPKGVVPSSAEQFYCGKTGRFTRKALKDAT